MEDGFTAVELIITIAILSFGILGIYGVFHPASVLTSNFYLHATADYLAQEGMEVVKNIRDNNIVNGLNWSDGLLSCSGGCQLDYKTGTLAETSTDKLQSYTGNNLNINGDGFYSYEKGKASIFKRKITITQPTSSPDVLRVDILVTWNYEGKSFSYETIEYIYNLT